VENIFNDYPEELAASSESGAPAYHLTSGYYAVHGEPEPSEAAPVFTIDEGPISVMRGEPDENAARTKLGAVYSLHRGGSLAVPTGQVLIRFVKGVAVVDRERQIKDAGYEIEQKLDYAPNTAWLRSRSKKIADALNGISALRKIPDVENVEPQMLMQAAHR